MSDKGFPVTEDELQDRYDCDETTVRTVVDEMLEDGSIEEIDDGLYDLADLGMFMANIHKYRSMSE